MNEGIIFTLDGSASYSPNNYSLSYLWTAPVGITLSSASAQKPTFTVPQVSANTTYTFSLVVNDGTVDSPADQVVVTVKNQNQSPVANAGIDQNVNEGAIATLDGSLSSDPDGDPLTYKWTAPTGITLSSTSVQKPTFTTPQVTANTTYTFSLVVNDGTVDSSPDQVVITVKNQNIAPVSNAGTDQVVNKGIVVGLDGSLSSDPDGNLLTYKWTAPAGIVLNSSSISNPTFTAPIVSQDTPYIFTLVVNDGSADSPVDQVTITVKNENKIPVANAGVDRTVMSGTEVVLDGSLSSDPDGNTLTYVWVAPSGIALSSSSIAKPIFIVPRGDHNAQLIFTLTVNDGTVFSTPDQVIITVKNGNSTPLANAGIEQTVNKKTTVMLDGSRSSDSDLDNLSYQWTAPAGIILSSNTIAKPTFTAPEVTQNTHYTFTLIVNDGFIDSSPATVKITVLNAFDVGFSDISAPAFKVYPNPTTGIVTLEFLKNGGKEREVCVTNMVGAEIFRKELIDGDKFQIDFSAYVDGIYLIKVTTDNQQYFSKVIVKKE